MSFLDDLAVELLAIWSSNDKVRHRGCWGLEDRQKNAMASIKSTIEVLTVIFTGSSP